MPTNPISGPILASLTQFWVPKNGEKLHFGPELRPLGPNSGHQFFFFSFLKNLAYSLNRFHGQLSLCTISKKLMIQSWENLVKDGRTDKQAD